MQASEVLLISEQLLLDYRELLLIDPFFRISIDAGDGERASMVSQEGPLAWRIKLDSGKHQDLLDIKYSIVDGLLRVMFASADRVVKDQPAYQESRDEILARLTSVFCTLLPDDLGDNNDAIGVEESSNVSD